MPASSSDNGSDSGDGDVDTSEVDTDELSSEEDGERDDAVRNAFLIRRNFLKAVFNLNHKTDEDMISPTTYQITLADQYISTVISRMRNPSTERRILPQWMPRRPRCDG